MKSSDGSFDGRTVPLAEAIETVREELADAEKRGEGSLLHFTVEKVTLEFAVQYHRGGGGSAGVRLGVVEGKVDGSGSRDSTHRVTVELQPHGEAGPVEVSRRGRGPSGR